MIENSLPEIMDANIRSAFDQMRQQKIDAVIVDEGGSFLANRALIVELAARYHLPAIYLYRDYVDAGGLGAYAPDLDETAQRLANTVHQILNGVRPGDIPFHQPTRFQLVVNLKTAKALNLTLPSSVAGRADEVIE